MLIASTLEQAHVAVLHRLMRMEAGQGLVEYAFILVLVAVVAIVALALVGDTVNNVLYRNGVCAIANTLSNQIGAC
ncbi:MAG: hypothetical protein WA009_11085 [Phototrophicaceae bacterium]|jgi:Flp pilus assembly pilin Flp|nr:MAG: Flp/Fap pilin component [Chloroflexi bacterium OLB13]MBV6437016.1 hypothetical protein [Anaerolineae bacterium]OQY86147.1 MAG: hypothetical protein B6D42_01855 [Anaerolineae bacterium UTCFX5]GIK28536.1 MAG: hypothetical protein BroJett007_16740 [Chloroflexota bacterium]